MASEIEFKLLVRDARALQAVAAAAVARGARVEAPVLQVNHFFDTVGGELRARDAIVRLRDEGGRWILAAKGAAEQAGELHRRTELELDVTEGEAERILAGQLDALRALELGLGSLDLLASLRAAVGQRALVPAGAFENERTRVGPLAVDGRELYLELDRTRFPGDATHHEIELEVPEGLEGPAGELLRELVAASGTEGTPAASKAARFFRALDARGA